MPITPEQARAELARRELARRQSQQQPEQPAQAPAQGQGNNMLNALLSLGGPLASALNPNSPQAQALSNMIGGTIRPPIQAIGQAGQQMESVISGQKPMSYDVPMPQSMGGNIPIRPPQDMAQAWGPAVETTMMVAAPQIVGGASKVLGRILKFDNALKQAQKSKVALDSLRTTLGQAKEIALQEIKDMPVEFNWSKIPDRALSAIQKSEYGVEIANGKIVNTIGNLDKAKIALQDVLTTKDYVEAGNMAKRQIKQFAGELRNTIVNAANKAGKPELSKALSDYHNFMDNYNLINDRLVDKYGNAMGNKLKTAFKWNAEPAVKEAWKEVGKASPEIKSVMGSMGRRELLKNLLKVGSATEVAKKTITGDW